MLALSVSSTQTNNFHALLNKQPAATLADIAKMKLIATIALGPHDIKPRNTEHTKFEHAIPVPH